MAKKHDVTLTEVVVTLLVAAILGAVLSGAVAQYEASHRTECRPGINNLETAIQNYRQQIAVP